MGVVGRDRREALTQRDDGRGRLLVAEERIHPRIVEVQAVRDNGGRQDRHEAPEGGDAPELALGEALLLESERQQLVRSALAQLKPECQELLRGLFYTHPPLSYEALAERLGRPQGSLGPTRLRCLKALRDALEGLGFN